MNISLEKIDAVTGKLTVVLEKNDYAENVEKSLKKLKQKAQMPGFRPGMVPMSLVKKMYEPSVKAEEIDKLVGSSLNDYIKKENLKLLAEPLMSKDQKGLDIEKDETLEFQFDIPLRPEFTAELSEKDTLTYYDIEVTDKMVDDQVKTHCSQMGKSVEVEKYEGESDLLHGKLEEMVEGGIVVEAASLMPKYFKDQDQAKLFENVAKDGEIVFNPSKAYEGNDAEIAALLKIKKDEVEGHKGDFKYTVTSISRFQPSELNQEVFDAVFGKDNVKDEADFRAKVKEGIQRAYTRDSDYKLQMDLRDYMIGKVGEMQFPETILKRNIESNLKENKEEKKNVDEVYQEQIPALKWMLIRDSLISFFKLEIKPEDIEEMARESVRMQFAQYGMNNVPDDLLNKYTENIMKNDKDREGLVSRAIDSGILAAAKKVVNLDHKPISVEDFNKMFE